MAGRGPSALPTGFVRLERGPVVLVVREEFVAAARELGLLEPDAPERWIRRTRPSAPDASAAPAGRGATATLPLPGHAERLLLRPCRRGGLLGPLWRGRLPGIRRPLRELAVTEALRARGAPVPRALLAVGQRARPGWRAAVGTVLEEGAVDGRRWLRETSPRRRRAAARAAGVAVRRLHDAGGRHCDLHVGNLLVCTEAGGGLAVRIVDLDRARAGRPPGPWRRQRELLRLERSLRKRGLDAALGAHGGAAFLAGYAGNDRGLRRALRRRHAPARLLEALHAVGLRRRLATHRSRPAGGAW